MDVSALDQYFQQAQKDWNVPGLSIAVVKDRKIVLAKGYGVLEKGKPLKADENSLYAIASNFLRKSTRKNNDMVRATQYGRPPRIIF